MQVIEMIKRIYIFSLIILALALVKNQAQSGQGDPTLLSKGIHNGNRIGITFYNDGQIGGANTGVDIRGEWPLGSGYNYIGDCIPLIGVEFFNNVTKKYQHSVTISRGPRKDQQDEKSPIDGHFWGWNPIPGYINQGQDIKTRSLAMSHLPNTWPTQGWADHPDWKDEDGKPQWDGYFGRGILNADQESYFVADDQKDDEFNGTNGEAFLPNPSDPSRKGMGLKMAVRGFQWANFLAEDCLFWLYDITNEGKTTYTKTDFGTVVGTLAGGDNDSNDDLGSFDITNSITYSWDSDGRGNKGQKVGWVGYAFLESPGNSFDGIDNDNDSQEPNTPRFVSADFDSVTYTAGSVVILIDPNTYERTKYTVTGTDTVYSMGVRFVIAPGKYFKEGNYKEVNGVSIPDADAYDGIDNDLDGLIDENKAIHWKTWNLQGVPGVAHINYITDAGSNDPLIDEKRDNDAGVLISSYVKQTDGTVVMKQHWSGDENGDWDAAYDDVGSDGLGPDDDGYPGPDNDGTEGNGRPDQGEPNFGKTDPEESDQIGLTGFSFFNNSSNAPSLKDDEDLWSRMTPGKYDVVPPQPMDGDFIYSSGYFPLRPGQIERFSESLVFGEDRDDIVRNKNVVQKIYNAGYKFPKPPEKPTMTLAQEDGKVVIYWDGSKSENSKDLVTKTKDFEGYKIYRATDAGFIDDRTITNATGVLSFDKPLVQFDLVDGVKGYFYPSADLLEQLGGTTFYLGDDTSGVVNKYVDEDVIKGQTYYYAVVAYDKGAEDLDIFPAENTKFIYRSNTGEIITDVNTGYITPGDRPVGYTSAKVNNFTKSENFRGTGTGGIEIIDDGKIKDGYSYKVVFTDTAAQGYTKDWSLVDLTTPDTVYIPSTGYNQIVNPTESVEIPNGAAYYINGKEYTGDGAPYVAPYDTLVFHSTRFSGSTPIKDGFRVQLYNDNKISIDTNNTFFTNVTNLPKTTITVFAPAANATKPDYKKNGVAMPHDYLIEFYDTVVDTSVADTNRSLAPYIFPAIPVTFKIKNLTTDEYINFVYVKPSSIVSTFYNIWFKENVGGVIKNTWRVDLSYLNVNVPLPTGGSYRISTFKPFSRYDSFNFSMKAPDINAEEAKTQLNDIKVVPNPYVVTHAAEARLLSTQTSGRGEREIRFTHVPPGAEISIFTVRGELIKKLRQESLYVGDVYWNLRTEENIEAAYGVYVYIVQAPGIGNKTGKFALIK